MEDGVVRYWGAVPPPAHIGSLPRHLPASSFPVRGSQMMYSVQQCCRLSFCAHRLGTQVEYGHDWNAESAAHAHTAGVCDRGGAMDYYGDCSWSRAQRECRYWEPTTTTTAADVYVGCAGPADSGAFYHSAPSVPRSSAAGVPRRQTCCRLQCCRAAAVCGSADDWMYGGRETAAGTVGWMYGGRETAAGTVGWMYGGGETAAGTVGWPDSCTGDVIVCRPDDCTAAVLPGHGHQLQLRGGASTRSSTTPAFSASSPDPAVWPAADLATTASPLATSQKLEYGTYDPQPVTTSLFPDANNTNGCYLQPTLDPVHRPSLSGNSFHSEYARMYRSTVCSSVGCCDGLGGPEMSNSFLQSTDSSHCVYAVEQHSTNVTDDVSSQGLDLKNTQVSQHIVADSGQLRLYNSPQLQLRSGGIGCRPSPLDLLASAAVLVDRGAAGDVTHVSSIVNTQIKLSPPSHRATSSPGSSGEYTSLLTSTHPSMEPDWDVGGDVMSEDEGRLVISLDETPARVPNSLADEDDTSDLKLEVDKQLPGSLLDQPLHRCDACDIDFQLASSLASHDCSGGSDLPARCDQLKQYLCAECGATFREKSNFNRHLRTHSSLRPYRCHTCGKAFKVAATLYVHRRTHEARGRFVCQVCEKDFKRPEHLRQHHRTHTGERPYECSVCHGRFTTDNTLRTHMRRHTGERPYPCPVCDKRFTQSSAMKTHWRRHSEQRDFSCPRCPASFKQKYDLTRHALAHSTERPFSCQQCQLTFKSRANLHKHADTHTHLQHTCPVCGKQFQRAAYLHGHQLTHAPRKRHSCQLCHKSFTRQYNLRVHVEQHHVPGTGPQLLHYCTLCDKSFRRRTGLCRHQTLTHHTLSQADTDAPHSVTIRH